MEGKHNTFKKKTDAQTNQDTKTSFSPQFSFFYKKTQQNSKGKGKLNLNKTVVGCDGGEKNKESTG